MYAQKVRPQGLRKIGLLTEAVVSVNCIADYSRSWLLFKLKSTRLLVYNWNNGLSNQQLVHAICIQNTEPNDGLQNNA
jgi:hypothetical protein